MDTRDTPEQAELRRSARQVARELGPATVADLDDGTRAKRLAVAVGEAGWLELRDDDVDGAPVASGVEAAIVADALGGAVADVAFTGPVLAADLARRAGVDPAAAAVVGFSPSLVEPGIVSGAETMTSLVAVDGAGHDGAVYALAPDGAGHRLVGVPIEGQPAESDGGSDLTRLLRVIPAGAPVRAVAGPARVLTADDLAAWTALGLALTSADLVGVMRGVLDVTVAYARERRQFGAPVGSFQAVQHLLAEARCLMDGSFSVALHASWAVDALEPEEALAAGRVAKAYCARAAKTVCEAAIQVHGGIGNTWECLAHVYLRRGLLSTQWFGDDGRQLRELGRERLGVGDGLP
ncbi:MAG TPA: acyl-CoA dehydrogenase family protein [Acidimicrobiia bacterium]|nr:acyl-CoA dehydrogenase family protein [Acidimicrobiia bacterium]